MYNLGNNNCLALWKHNVNLLLQSKIYVVFRQSLTSISSVCRVHKKGNRTLECFSAFII